MDAELPSLTNGTSDDDSFVVLGRSILIQNEHGEASRQHESVTTATVSSTPPIFKIKNEADVVLTNPTQSGTFKSALPSTMLSTSSTPTNNEQSFVSIRNSIKESSASNNLFPKMPTLNQSQLITSCALNTSTFSTESDLTVDEIQNKLSAVLAENMFLKEVLNENNIAIKTQFEKLVDWQEKVMEVHNSHREKFEETKQLISLLRVENTNLKRKTNTIEELEVANESLKKKLEMFENNHMSLPVDTSEQKWSELVDQLSNQLSLVERARRDEVINNQREIDAKRAENIALREQLLATQMKLTEYSTRKESLKSFHADSITAEIDKNDSNALLISNAVQYEEHIMNLKRFFNGQKQRQILLQNCLESAINAISYDKLQNEVQNLLQALEKELNNNESDVSLTDKFISMQNFFHKIFIDYKMLHQQLDNTRAELDNTLVDLNVANKQVIGLKTDLAAAKGEIKELVRLNEELTEQIRVLKTELTYQQAQPKYNADEMVQLNETIGILHNEIVIKDSCLQRKNDEILQMQKQIDSLRVENESIAILKAQVELYQTDFNAEKESRIRLQDEKSQIAEDLRLLQRRNQQLIEQVESFTVQVPIQAPPPPNKSNSSNAFACPICNQSFRTLRFLEDHLDQCLPV